MTAELEVDGRRVAVSNLDRVLWPSTGYTKGQMLAYYLRIAAALLPHVRGRPVVLGRFPEGVHGRGWGQFECRGHPEWMATRRLALRTGSARNFCLVNDTPSLAWVANQGVVELHPYLAPADAFDVPASVVFDLDPGAPAAILECGRAALWLRALLDGIGLKAFPKTSGGSGLHVIVPLNTPHDYGHTKAFARDVARRLADTHPDAVVDRMAKSLRVGRVFVDWGQNDQRKQTVAAYSLRATEVPSVSTPVAWDELAAAVARGDGRALAFGPADAIDRVERLGDLHGPVVGLRQRLPR